MRKERQIIEVAALGAIALFSGASGAETVRQAVREALATNPQIHAAFNERYAAQAKARETLSGFYARVNIVGAYGWENSDNVYTREALNQTGYLGLRRKQASISITQNLFDGFATTDNKERDDALVNASAFNVQEEAQRVALATINAYLDVRRWQDIVVLAQEVLRVHQHIYDNIHRRVGAGRGTAADVEQAKGRLALAQSNLVVAHASLRNAIIRYRGVVGQYPDNSLVLPEVPSGMIPVSLDQAMQMAANNNPLLKGRQAQVTAALAAKKATFATYYPRVNFVASQNWGENLYGREGIDRGYSAMLNIRYDLYNGGADSAKTRASVSRANQTMDERNLEVRRLMSATRMEWHRYQTSRMREALLLQRRDAAQKTQNAYREQYDIGRRSLLDMLDSENEVFIASRDYIDNEYDKLSAAYGLLANAGTLLPSVGAPMPGAGRCVQYEDCLAPVYSTPAQTVVFAQAVDREKKESEYRLGGFVVKPSLSVTEMSDDNVYATPDNKKSDTATLAGVSLTATSDWGRNMLSFNVGGTATRYWQYSSENTSDYWGGINGRVYVGQTSNIFGSVSRSYLHEDRISPDYVYTTVPVSPVVYHDTSGQVGASIHIKNTAVRVVGAYTRLDYENVATTSGGVLDNDVRDRDVYGYGARWTLNENGMYRPFVQAAYETRSYDKARDGYGYSHDSSGSRGVIGMSLHGGAVQGEVFAGRLYQHYTDVRFSDVNDADYGLKMGWVPVHEFKFVFNVQHSLEETTVQGASGFLYTKVSGTAEYKLSSAWKMRLGASSGRSDYQMISRVDKISDVGVGVGYDFAPGATVDFELQHIERRSDEPLDNYDSRRVMAKISAKF